MRKRLIAGLLAVVALPGTALAACPFSYVFNYVSAPQPIGVIAGGVGTGTTIFQTSTSGNVTKISGPGSLAGSASSRQVQVQLAMTNCSNVNNVKKFNGCSDTPTVTVSAVGAPTGLNQSLTAFTAASTGGGTITGTSGSAPLTLQMSPSGVTYYAGWNFNLGYNLPIGAAGTGSTGNGSSALSINITPSTAGCSGASTTATVPTLVNTPLTISNQGSFSFGTIVRPPSGSGTVTYTPTSGGGGSMALTGGASAVPSPAPTAGVFRIQGQQYGQVVITLDTSVNLTSGANTIVLTPIGVWGSDASGGNPSFNSGSNGTGHVNLSNANGEVTLYVGGSFPITSSTPTGNYSGQITATAVYQ